MPKRQTQPWSICTALLLAGWLLAAPLFTPYLLQAAPPAQDVIVRLDAYANDTTMHPRYGVDFWDDYSYAVYVPAGSRLNVWVGEGSQGGCSWEVSLKYEGSYVDSTSSSSAPNSWSDRPASAVIGSGYAEVYLFPDTSCDGPVPHDINVRFAISDQSPAPISPTPTPTSNAQPPRQPVIDFWADSTRLRRGECTTLHWRVENVKEIYYQGGGVTGSGDRQECPQVTSTYELQVLTDRGWETWQVQVYVEEPTPTPSYSWPTHTPTYSWPTPTATRPPTSTLQPSPTARPTFTGTPRPMPTPTRLPTGTPRLTATTRRATTTPRPGATPTSRPTMPPQVVVQRPDRMPRYLILTHIGRLNQEFGTTGSWSDVKLLLDQRYGNTYWVLDYEPYLGWDYDFHQAYDILVQETAAMGQPAYIVIMGGPDVVPFSEFNNPCGHLDDTDRVFSDDVYADLVHDPGYVPEVPVARLPDAGDFAFVRAVFQHGSNPAAPANKVFCYGQPLRDYFLDMNMAIKGLTRHDVSPNDPADHTAICVPFNYSDGNVGERYFNAGWVDALHTYFILHGSKGDTSVWTGENPDIACTTVTTASGGHIRQCPASRYPLALAASEANSRGLVVSEACYGAYVSHTGDLNQTQRGGPKKTNNNSIALRFLFNGARAFIGSTTSTYSETKYEVPKKRSWLDNMLDGISGSGIKIDARGPCGPLDCGVQRFSTNVLLGFGWGRTHPLDAYYRAKMDFAALPEKTCGEMKAQRSYVFYGLAP